MNHYENTHNVLCHNNITSWNSIRIRENGDIVSVKNTVSSRAIRYKFLSYLLHQFTHLEASSEWQMCVYWRDISCDRTNTCMYKTQSSFINVINFLLAPWVLLGICSHRLKWFLAVLSAKCDNIMCLWRMKNDAVLDRFSRKWKNWLRFFIRIDWWYKLNIRFLNQFISVSIGKTFFVRTVCK